LHVRRHGSFDAGPAAAGQSSTRRKLGVALCGLGNYARDQLGPALTLTQKCELRGVITGSPGKGAAWAKEYGFPAKNVYGYDTMAQLSENLDIDIVYIVTPNGLHAQHVIAAAGGTSARGSVSIPANTARAANRSWAASPSEGADTSERSGGEYYLDEAPQLGKIQLRDLAERGGQAITQKQSRDGACKQARTDHVEHPAE
jgi:Oxidoreductase family, NAD-binding Rossmann fold